MGFFDSKKKTENNNITNDYTTANTDNRYAELELGDGAVGISGDVAGALTINSVDPGSYELAGQALQLGQSYLDYGADSLEMGYEFLGDTQDNTFDWSRGLLTETVGQLNSTARDFAQLTQQSLESTQTAYRTANTSEDGRISEKLIIGVIVVAALWVLIPVLKIN